MNIHIYIYPWICMYVYKCSRAHIMHIISLWQSPTPHMYSGWRAECNTSCQLHAPSTDNIGSVTKIRIQKWLRILRVWSKMCRWDFEGDLCQVKWDHLLTASRVISTDMRVLMVGKLLSTYQNIPQPIRGLTTTNRTNQRTGTFDLYKMTDTWLLWEEVSWENGL